MSTLDKEHLQSLVVQTSIDQLSMYLMVVPPPPKKIWVLLESYINRLYKGEAISPDDTLELFEWSKICAKKVGSIGEDISEVSSDSMEFQALFHFYTSQVLLELQRLKYGSKDKEAHYTMALAALKQLHLECYPLHQKVLREWGELKRKSE